MLLLLLPDAVLGVGVGVWPDISVFEVKGFLKNKILNYGLKVYD